MVTLLRPCICVLLIQVVTCACKNGAKPCEWEPWQPWSSCSRTCGVGYRTRNRNLCCGPIVKDCAHNCYRGDNNKQVEVCNDSCPNGATLIDDICQCPPLKYGPCCDSDESDAEGDEIACARHCTWTNWHSWGKCSANCGCGTRERTRSLCCSHTIVMNGTLCHDDCNMRDTKENRSCTKSCSSKQEPDGCSLCTWHNWGSWSSCSSDCGGGQRSRSRSPCCCNQTLEECLKDCDLLETETTQEIPCNQLCSPGGNFTNNSCVCKAGYAGKCCSTEVTVGSCKKCSWQAWQSWEETGEDGNMKRKRELCCRMGQGAEDCRSECGAEEHSQGQILMNDTTTGAKLGTPIYHTDLNLFLYAGGIALVTILVTSLVWVGCCYLKMKKREKAQNDPRTDAATGNVYEMSVSEEGAYHDYAGLDPGSIY